MTNKTLVDEIMKDISAINGPLWEMYDIIKSILEKHLQSIKQTEEDNKSSFQILYMFTTIINELSKYHSYKNIVQQLEKIKLILKDDWSGKIRASNMVSDEMLRDSYRYEKGIKAGKKIIQELNIKTINNTYYCNGCKRYVTVPHQCSNLTNYS